MTEKNKQTSLSYKPSVKDEKEPVIQEEDFTPVATPEVMEEKTDGAITEKAPEEVTKETQADPTAKPSGKKEKLPAYQNESFRKVEDARQEFLRKYKIHNISKWIVTAVCLLLIIIAWVGFAQIKDDEKEMPQWVMPLQIMTVIFAVGLISLYTFLMSRWLKKKMRGYFKTYYNAANACVFPEEDGYEEVSAVIDGKIDPSTFYENDLFKDVVQVGSRNIVRYVYHGTAIESCDCAGQIRSNKRFVPIFVGRYLYASVKHVSDEPIVIYLKGDKRSIPPTNVADLPIVFSDEKMVIQTKDSAWRKVIDRNVRKALDSFKTGGILIDVSIAIRKGRVYVLLGFDDALMAIMIDKPFDHRPLLEAKTAMLAGSEFIAALN